MHGINSQFLPSRSSPNTGKITLKKRGEKRVGERDSKWLMLSLCGVVFCLLPLFSLDVLAEPQALVSTKVQGLSGLTKAAVESRFGVPDKIESDQAGRTIWHYGASTLFFSGDQVSAWTDEGELVKRSAALSMKSDKLRSDDLKGDWTNPWTP